MGIFFAGLVINPKGLDYLVKNLKQGGYCLSSFLFDWR